MKSTGFQLFVLLLATEKGVKSSFLLAKFSSSTVMKFSSEYSDKLRFQVLLIKFKSIHYF